MIQDLDLQELRRRLEEKLARLQGHMEEHLEKEGRRRGANLDRDDLARNFASRERHLALRDAEQAQMAQIEKALERMASGNYGRCAGCGAVILLERLEIIPYATLCIRCQQEQDQI
jgi:RNA polymerase-binding protein DksA